jgi:Heterokaryon incompatibility protein (HET)
MSGRRLQSGHLPERLIRSASPLTAESAAQNSAWKLVGPGECSLHRARTPAGEVHQHDAAPCIKSLKAASFQAPYSPLQPYQTRLLRLEPGETEDTLSSTLCIVDLLHHEGVVISGTREWTTYEAVSYSWGYPTPTHTLKCNNNLMPILGTQYQMLRRFRQPERPRYLWIDALCINQADADEKADQIAKMFLIFRKASTVLVWLGEESHGERFAVRACHQIAEQHEGVTAESMPLPACSDCLQHFASGIHSLLDRPWFRRTWVRQEIFAARKISIHFGDFICSWEAFGDILERYDLAKLLPPDERQDLPRDVLAISSLAGLKRASQAELGRLNVGDTARGSFLKIGLPISMHNYLNPKEQAQDARSELCDLAGVLANSGHFEATDDRDKIYAVLGMTNVQPTGKSGEGTTQMTISISYLKSVSEVFQEATKYLVNREGSLDVLYLAPYYSAGDLEIPSWTPDWRNVALPLPSPHFQFTGRSSDRQRSGAIQHTSAEGDLWIDGPYYHKIKETPWQDANEHGVLRSKGWFCGTIVQREGLLELVPDELPSPAEITDTFPELKVPRCRAYVSLHIINPPATLGSGSVLWPEIEIPTGMQWFRHAFVPEQTQVHDIMVFLLGARTPMILRPLSQQAAQSRFLFVGAAYVAQDFVKEMPWAPEHESYKRRAARERRQEIGLSREETNPFWTFVSNLPTFEEQTYILV